MDLMKKGNNFIYCHKIVIIIFLDISKLQDDTSRERYNCCLSTRNSLGSHVDIDDRYDRSWLHFNV